MWETKAGKFTASKKVTVYFRLPVFSAKNILMLKFYVDESDNSR